MLCLAYAGIAAAWPFHAVLLAVVLVTFLYRLRIGLLWAIVGGILLNGLTVAGNGIWILGFVAASLAVHYLVQVWFPARSLLSAGIVAPLGVVVFESVTRTVSQLLIGSGARWTWQTPVSILLHMLWAMGIVTGIVGVARIRNARLRNAYLIR